MNYHRSDHAAVFVTHSQGNQDHPLIPRSSLQTADNYLQCSRPTRAAAESPCAASVHRCSGQPPSSFRISPDQPGTEPSQAELTTDWWRWAYSIPANQSPFNDLSGEFADVNQSGRDFFLTGALFVPGASEPAAPGTTRTITVNAGKEIFFPVVNVEWDNAQLGYYFGLPALTPSELRNLNTANLETTTGMFLEVDGRTLFSDAAWDDPWVQSFRQVTPTPSGFSYTFPGPEAAQNVLGLPWTATSNGQGLIEGGMSDGIWVHLEFAPGAHALSFGGVFNFGNISIDLDGDGTPNEPGKESAYQTAFQGQGTFTLGVNYRLNQL